MTKLVGTAKEIVDSGACHRSRPQQGDWILANYTDYPAMLEQINRQHAEGVRDEDIRWWWNLAPMDAAYMIAHDEITIQASFMGFLRQGIPWQEAAAKAKKSWPQFGVQEDTSVDRALPIELRERVMKYLEQQGQRGDVDAWQRKLDAASLFNALIRAEIRAGNV